MRKQKSWINFIALVVCLAVALTLVPFAAFAEDGDCTHAHDETCGYAEGSPCEHTHDDGCGFAEETPETPCDMGCEGGEHAEDCSYSPAVPGADCGHEHDGDCGFIEPVPCAHEHDESCGGLDEPTGDTTGSAEEPGVTANRITAFAPLPEDIRFQRGQASELVLPETVEATVDGESVTIPVTWPEPDGYSPRTPGLYVFTAAIPEPYTLAEDIEAPSLSFMQAGLARIAGYGTELNPLEIRNAEQLEEVAALVNTGQLEQTVFGVSDQTVYLRLENDIALSGEWTPIGNDPNAFKGVFDGGGNTITGLTITGGNFQGLFGYIYGGTVKDLMLKDVNVSGTIYVGGVAGYVLGGNIVDCAVIGSVSGNAYIGGVAGEVFGYGSVTGCVFTGSVSGTGNSVGGVAGEVIGGSVTDCYSLGPSVTGDTYTGRVVGYVYGGTLDNNKAWAGMEVNGNTTSSADATSLHGEDISTADAVEYLEANGIDVPAHLLTGGSITEIHTAEDLQAFRDDVNSGNSYSGETVTLMDDITFSGEWTPIGTNVNPFSGTFDGGGKTITGLSITSDRDYQGLFGLLVGGTVKDLTLKDVNVSGQSHVGGVVGTILDNGSIENCVVTGSVSGILYVGGVAGEVYIGGSIENCTVLGSVSSTSAYVGGVAGHVLGGSVTGCYALGPSVTGGSYTGRVVGDNDGTLDNNVAWDGMTGGGANNTADGKGGADISTAEAVAYLTDKGIPIPEHLRESGNITQIWTQADLVALADDVNGGITYSGLEVKLMDNITLSGNWTPIGNLQHLFSGTFDGGGKTITGLTITGSSREQGLFGFISGGVVKDLTLKDVNVSGYMDVGGVAGVLASGSIENCAVSGSVNGNERVGGVVGVVSHSAPSGSLTGGRLTDCLVTGSVSGGRYVGGVAGRVGGSVTGCVATGSVSAGSSVDFVGGVAGEVNGGGSVTDCAALNPSVTGGSYTGRVVGVNKGTLDYNVAWAGMTVNGNTVTSSDATSIHGADISMEDIERDYGDIFDQGDFRFRRTGISGAVVTLEPTSYIYNGSAKMPDITVTLNGTALKGTDYEYKVTSENDTDNNTSAGINAGTVTLTITGNGDYGDSATKEFVINKAEQDAPDAPTAASVGADSITLAPIASAEYSIDGTNWQDETTFGGLEAGVGYTFYARLKADDNHNASPASPESQTITTLSGSGNGGGDTPVDPIDPPDDSDDDNDNGWIPSGNDDHDDDPAPVARSLAPAEKWMTAANWRNPSRESLRFGVRASAWDVLTGPYYHDSIRNNAVEVRTYFDDPGLFTADSYVSGWTSGLDVDKARATFEKWFTNKIRTIHFDRAGMWEHPVRVAARVDLAGWDTTRLVFYYYDPKANLYRKLANPAYWIDANGYLHLKTEFAGEIVVSEGELEKR